MLNVLCKAGSVLPLVEIGGYVPLKIIMASSNAESHVYWRTGDLTNSLLEIQIDAATGLMIEICLLLPGVVQEGLTKTYLSTQVFQGVPAVKTEAWSNHRYIDDPHDIHAHVANGEVQIFLNDMPVESVMEWHNVAFGVAKGGGLVWISACHPESLSLLTLY